MYSEQEFLEFIEGFVRDRIVHTTSASAMKTFKMCRRKWWLEKIRKLDTPIKQYGVLGTALHSVCERFLTADDKGYDRETGKPVELYPEGWEIVLATYPAHRESCRGHRDHPDHGSWEKHEECDCPHEVEGSLSVEEQVLVKKLVDEAISEGVLERHVGREIEKRLDFKAYSDGIGDVNVVGFIDCEEPDMIQDHKTTSRMKYALSKAKLFSDLQMNLYAYWHVFLSPDADPDLKSMWLRHNVYCKDPNDFRVKKTEVEKTVDRIRGYFEQEIEPCFRQMLLLIKNTRKWSDIDPPEDIAGACNAYGGCPFLSICAGSETIEMYIKRVDRINERAKKADCENNQNQQERGKGMSLLDKKKKKGTTEKNNTTTKKPETVSEPAEPATEQPDNARPAHAAPWYVDGCQACSKNDIPGISTNGKPCLICASKNRGKVDVEDYEKREEDGEIVWVKKDTGETVAKDASTKNSKVKAEEAVADAATIDEDEAKEKAAKEKAKAGKKAAEEAEREKRKGSGKTQIQASLALDPKGGPERKKFVLVLGGTSADGTMSSGAAIGNVNRVVTIEELMALVGSSVASVYEAKTGMEGLSLYDVEAFERRDLIASKADEIADLLGNSTLACPAHLTPDEKSLVAVLRPLASRVFICFP